MKLDVEGLFLEMWWAEFSGHAHGECLADAKTHVDGSNIEDLGPPVYSSGID